MNMVLIEINQCIQKEKENIMFQLVKENIYRNDDSIN